MNQTTGVLDAHKQILIRLLQINEDDLNIELLESIDQIPIYNSMKIGDRDIEITFRMKFIASKLLPFFNTNL